MKLPPASSAEALAWAADEASDETGPEPWLRCAACRGRVAEARARTEVNGAHEHAFVNPAGLRFVVGCFAAAPGTVPDGERSTVWTWFPGHAWQIALCRTCGAHLGWSFHAATGGRAFWGLVLDRLVRDAGAG